MNKKQDDLIIDIKLKNKEQLISDYSYDNFETLNQNLEDYLITKTKNIYPFQEVQFNIYNSTSLSKNEISHIFQSHFNNELTESKQELKRCNKISFVLLILGVLALASLLIFTKLFNNFYLKTILEIAAWVFIWESVDVFFLQRNKTKKRCMQINKILSANINIIKNKKQS